MAGNGAKSAGVKQSGAKKKVVKKETGLGLTNWKADNLGSGILRITMESLRAKQFKYLNQQQQQHQFGSNGFGSPRILPRLQSKRNMRAPRMRWTSSLHDRFVHAVELLGGHERKRPLTDVWALDTAAKPYEWRKLEPEGEGPPPCMSRNGCRNSLL